MICVGLLPALRAQTSATFGEVISLGYTPSDIVLDESRHRLYLVNAPGNSVDVYDYSAKAVAGSFSVGQNPLGAAMSMDNAFLYVASHDSSTLSVISLGGASLGVVVNTVALPAKPQGVEVGADGRVLIATDGSGTSSTTNTLLLFDSLQTAANQVLAVPFNPAPATPPALAPPTATRVVTQFNGRLKRTADGKYIVGVSSITNNTQSVMYIYETASGTLLESRTVTGQSSTLSVAPDGASFMAGFTLFDTATLNVLGQQSTANAPFAMTNPANGALLTFNAATNYGGSVFSPDLKTLYSAFNVAATTTPPSTPQATTLLISDPRTLAINLGVNLPESILANMVITADGNDIWALSSSGLLHLPVGHLYDYPILMPQTTTLFLAQDDCNLGIAQAVVPINNIGGGTLTFAVPQTISGGSAALVATASSGVAPATVTFTMDPGRSGVIRTPGTNLYTGAGASNTGAAVNVQLASPDAINVPPTIRVFMNYRDSTMRGLIYPVPTAPNATPTPTTTNATTLAYQGLWDLVLDEPRHRLYISNPGYNRVEVFDTQALAFQTPIPAGQLPHQMAMSLDGSTLYVANTGGETVAMVDLNQQQATGFIQFPPIPRAGNVPTTTYVSGMALGLSGLQMVRSDGNLWTVIGNQAVPRTPTAVTGISSNGAQTPINNTATVQPALLGSDDGALGILMSANGTAYVYDGLLDAYTTNSQLFTTGGYTGFYGPLGAAPGGGFLLANGLILNKALTVLGGVASPGQVSVSINFPAGPGGGFPGITTNVSSNGARNIAAVAPINQQLFVRMSTPVRNSLTSATSDDIHTTLEALNTQTGATATAARMPENPVLSKFGGGRTTLPARQMVVDSQGTVYALTLSGLSVVPLAPASSSTQPQIAAAGILNANDGSNTFQPGSFININGSNLASNAVAATLPPPTVLGGSCVLVDNVAIPLLQTSPGQISAQLPASIRPGLNVVQVRSLAAAQRSTRVLVTIQKP